MTRILAIILTCTFAAGYTDLDSGVFGSEKMMNIKKERRRPFNVDVSYDYIGSSEFTNKPYKHECQKYSEGEIELGAVFYYKACYDEGARATLGFTRANFDWKGNPFFRQSKFNMLGFELGAVTKRFACWQWQANVSVNVDTDHFNFNKYANYDLLLWGRYDWCRCIGVHTGFIAYTGMNVNKVFPILGFDWQISRKWKLNAIFPVNMSLVYTINKNFSGALAGRFFFNRYRAGKHEPVPEAIFEYRNGGIELAFNYEYCSWIKVNLHGGSTVGGEVRISDCNHRHKKNLNIGPAPYAGFEADVRF